MTIFLNAPPNASMDPWMSVDDGDAMVLFGYSHRHARLGGRSWIRSSPLVSIDPSQGRAETASGRIYELGRQITLAELPDDEARAAFALLIGPASRHHAPEDNDVRAWMQAAKIARWVGIEPPGKDDAEATRLFIKVHLPRYAALRQRDFRDQQGVG